MADYNENYIQLRELLAQNHHHIVNSLPINAESVVCVAGCSSGDNYMSIVKRIQVKSKTKTGKNNDVSMIIKRQVSNQQRRMIKMFPKEYFAKIFSNEIHAYNVILPYLQNYMQSYEDRIFPECYYAGNDQANELIIIFEDLREIGFSLFNRQIDMDLNICKAVVKQLAKLHAASLVAQVVDDAGFQKLRENLFDVVYSEKAEPIYSKLLKSSLSIALHSLELSNTDGSLTKPIGQLKQLKKKVFKCMRNYVLRADTSMPSVICHGDLWVNNIMVNGSTEQTDIKFVDLQALRYGSPVFDILHFIYTGTRRELRDNHTDTILETYCTTLAQILEVRLPKENGDLFRTLKDSYSLGNIRDQYYRNLFYGLGVSMWILPACTFDPDNLPNLDNISSSSGSDTKCDKKILQTVKNKLTNRFHVRMKETVLEFHENGVLTNLIDDLETFDDLNVNENVNHAAREEVEPVDEEEGERE